MVLGIGRKKGADKGLQQMKIPLFELPQPTDFALATACGGLEQAEYMKNLFLLAQETAQKVEIGETISVTINGLGARVQADAVNFAICLALMCPDYGLTCEYNAVKDDTITFRRAT